MPDIFSLNSRPPSPDPGKYIWVNSKEGGHWRRLRGTVKKAELNPAFKRSSEYMKISGPAAKYIIAKLRPHLNGLAPGRLNSRISAKLRDSLKSNGSLDFTFFKGFDFQPDYAIGKLMQGMPNIKLQKGELLVEIPIDHYTLKRHSPLVTHYYFELIMLHGNAAKDNSLKIESESSEVYEIESKKKSPCRFNMVIPTSPWMAILKVNCIEGHELAYSPRNYAMKVMSFG